MDINAAVVSSFDKPPRYEPFDLTAPADDDQALVDVLAVGLHPRVRTGASGSHYTSTGKLPLVPGVDGVGRLAFRGAARRQHRRPVRAGTAKRIDGAGR